MDTFLLAWGFLGLCLPGSGGTAETAQPCGGRLNSKDAGYITSPGYPNDYPSHQNCEWVIYAPEANQKIILNFNPHFEIEKHDCKNSGQIFEEISKQSEAQWNDYKTQQYCGYTRCNWMQQIENKLPRNPKPLCTRAPRPGSPAAAIGFWSF